MNPGNKRKDPQHDDNNPKRGKKECEYAERCYRRNPAHLREFSHPHLEAILDTYKGTGPYAIPEKYSKDQITIREQLDVIVEKELYMPWKKVETPVAENNVAVVRPNEGRNCDGGNTSTAPTSQPVKMEPSTSNDTSTTQDTSEYRPIVPPIRRIGDFFKVVRPPGQMASKHDASAPYHIFYTTITDVAETHQQKYSITFQEILDRSLGELKCSLQINFMVDLAWLLAHYYFAGYSAKKLTILYGEDSSDLREINKSKPHIDAHHVRMPTPFGKHHTKMMLLWYEDGTMRVVVSTANLYLDDWENRVQGLWISPRCPKMTPTTVPCDGDSPSKFKQSLLRYLKHYELSAVEPYIEQVNRCDFSHINVVLVASTPGTYFTPEWGLKRMGSELRKYCTIPAGDTLKWPLIAQASSIGSYGKEPSMWLMGEFSHQLCKYKRQPLEPAAKPPLKLIYPSLENVQNSVDGLLGGGCLPYAASIHSKQPWLNNYLYQWRAQSTGRDRAMPHIKSYTRVSPDNKHAAYFLLTSANCSKAAWGVTNKGNGGLRIASYEAGVLFLPPLVTGEEQFPLEKDAKNRLVLPYDVPPVKYTTDMSPWVSDYLSD